MQCKACSDVKFSAASDNLECPCGGRFRIIPFAEDEQITQMNETTKKLFDFSNLFSNFIRHDDKQKFN